MTQTCNHCGNPLEPTHRICTQCGRAVSKWNFSSKGPASTAPIKSLPKANRVHAIKNLNNAESTTPDFDDHGREAARALIPQIGEIESIFSAVKSSPHIRGNTSYNETASKIELIYWPDSLVVNASAASKSDEDNGEDNGEDESEELVRQTSSSRQIKTPVVNYHLGWDYMMRCVSISVASCIDDRTNKLISASELAHALQKCSQSMGDGEFIESELDYFYEQACSLSSRGLARARDITRSINTEAIAHEIGHIVLHHLDTEHLLNETYEISRNQERQADDFASNVLGSMSYREHVFLGHAVSSMFFCWLEETMKPGQVTTHPHSRERLENALRGNSQAAKEAAETYGLTKDFIMQAIPPAPL